MKNKKININIPTSWNELSTDQYLKVIRLIHSTKKTMFILTRLFFILADVKWFQIKKRANVFLILSLVPMSELKKNFMFIFEKDNRTIFPETITINKIKYFAPANRIVNISVDEFSVAHDLYNKYIQTKNIEFLHYLAATLYVTVKNPRPEFNKYLLEEKVKEFAKLSPTMLLSIHVAFSGSLQYLFEKFPVAFPQKQNTTKSSSRKYGLGKVILQMAGGKFGNLTETKKTNIISFLEQFEEDLRNNQKQK